MPYGYNLVQYTWKGVRDYIITQLRSNLWFSGPPTIAAVHCNEQTVFWRWGVRQQTGIPCSSILNRSYTAQNLLNTCHFFFSKKKKKKRSYWNKSTSDTNHKYLCIWASFSQCRFFLQAAVNDTSYQICLKYSTEVEQAWVPNKNLLN